MKAQFVSAVLFAAILCSCQKAEPLRTHLYPGNPDEDSAPTLVKDNEYRNIALNKAAYASSSWDYNLTAQLATDGITDSSMPQHFVLSTADGLVPKNQREWAFDWKSNSMLKISGQNNFLQLDLVGYELEFDNIEIVARVQPKIQRTAYYGVPGQEAGAISPVRRSQARMEPVRWSVTFQGSSDGQAWTDLDRREGQSNQFSIQMSKKGNYSHYRLVLDSDKADSWSIGDWDFFNDGIRLEFSDLMTESYKRDVLNPVQPAFSSAWMSEGSGHEWIYVDLGTVADVDKVNLTWLSALPSGKVQVSDDAHLWKDVADIAKTVQVSGKARYVRLDLQGGGPYVLSEFEVFGKGGLVAQPKAQPAPQGDRMYLTGGQWRLSRADQVRSSAEAISTGGFDSSEWLVASVPATVLSSYIHNAAVPDPNYSDNQLQISESFFLSDFWYRDEFTLPAGFAKEKVFLNFDGINWKAQVYLNGKSLGQIDGAFTRGLFDVTDILREGENTLAVKILKPDHPGTIKEQTAISTDSNGGVLGADNPTFHATVGWDWIPTVRGRDIGIWNDVYLSTTGSVRLSDPFVRSELNLPDTTEATVFVQATLTNYGSSAVHGVLAGKLGEYTVSQDVTLSAGETRTVDIDPLKITNPRLWWPVGYGEPYLYDTQITFTTDDGKVSDSESFKSGIRQMTSDIVDGALMLYVNGRRFIGRGGNWGFAESNLAYRGREYDIAVKYHADMNFTMVRNWVGQIGDEEFFEACDRHGVMIWQDFWLANPWDGPDPYDEEMFLQNASDFVRKIRNHASVGLYCGRNEGMPTESLDLAFQSLVAELHPGQKYIPHSAASEVSGGGPYRALPVKDYFNQPGADRFHSERGMPNVMNYESLLRTIPEQNLWPQNNIWGIHDFTLESAQYGNSFNDLLEKGFGPAGDAREFTELAQWVNYNGYRAMFEGRSRHRQGLLLWMSHSCWPSMVWQTYDYYFDPTAAYFACKKASEPLHIQYNALTNRVEVVNMSGSDGRSLDAKVEVIDMYGKIVWDKSQAVISDEDTTLELMSVEVPSGITPAYYLRLTLSEAGSPVSENFYWEGVEEGNYQALRSLSDAKVTSRGKIQKKGGSWKATFTVKNTSDTPAMMLRLKLFNGSDPDRDLVLPVVWSDNYFFLMPGESKTVSAEFPDFACKGKTPKLSITGLNVK